MTDKELVAYVKAVNKCHFIANQLFVRLDDVFRPMVGRSIKWDDTLLAKLNRIANDYPTYCSIRRNCAILYYTPLAPNYISWNVGVYEPFGDYPYCVWYSVRIKVGEVAKDGTLKRILDRPLLCNTYTKEFVASKIKKYKEAKKLYLECKDSLEPFIASICIE